MDTLKFIVENAEAKTYSGNLLIDTDKVFLPIQQERNFKFVSKKAIAALVSSLKNPKAKLEHKQVFDDALKQAIKRSGTPGIAFMSNGAKSKVDSFFEDVIQSCK